MLYPWALNASCTFCLKLPDRWCRCAVWHGYRHQIRNASIFSYKRLCLSVFLSIRPPTRPVFLKKIHDFLQLIILCIDSQENLRILRLHRKFHWVFPIMLYTFFYKHNVYKHNQPEILVFLNTSQPQIFLILLTNFLALAFSKQKLV